MWTAWRQVSTNSKKLGGVSGLAFQREAMHASSLCFGSNLIWTWVHTNIDSASRSRPLKKQRQNYSTPVDPRQYQISNKKRLDGLSSMSGEVSRPWKGTGCSI